MTTSTDAPVAGEFLDMADESPEALYELLAEYGWGDGLPVVAPTPERVDEMLAGWARSPDEVLAVLPPRSGACTVQMAAINAVMAGCPPAVFPVVVAAVRALGHQEFNLRGVQATTHSVAIMVAVHGAIADAAGFNAGAGAFGPGWRANATTGRAVRLILLHVGGGRPGDGDASTQGQPAKYTYCFAEHAAASPWPLYPHSRGVLTPSAVTVAGVEGPHNAHDMWSATAAPIYQKIASVMTTLGSNHAPMMDSEMFIVLCPEHAAQAAAEGWTREDVQSFLYETARLPLRVWREHFPFRGMDTPWAKSIDDPEYLMPLLSRPDNARVLVAGGPGKHSCVVPSWGGITRSVTVPVED
ncbi:MAG TPA: hypothetical protein VKD67_00915 [Acidimicrobiales bacterium]|nr:hypothetical protein [Acidimicrobiales bacterium]